MEQFKIRASAAGQIMTESLGKSNSEKLEETRTKLAETQSKLLALSDKAVKTAEKLNEKMVYYSNDILFLEAQLSQGIDKELSKTCTSYLLQWYIEQATGRRKEVKAKQMQKGILVEEDAILQVAMQDMDFHTKNEKQFSNDWFTGTPDIVTDTKVIDIKSSWDIFTFTNVKMEDINKNYYYQLQVYMDLCDKQEAELIYCLMNTPELVYRNEIRKAEWANGIYEELPEEEMKQLYLNHHFDDLPTQSRFYRISVERDDNVIANIKSRVEQCRQYIESNLFNILNW